MILDTTLKRRKDLLAPDLYEDGDAKNDTPTTDQTKTDTPTTDQTKTDTPTTDQTKTDTATTTTTPVEYNSTAFRDTAEGAKFWSDYVDADTKYNEGSTFTYANQGDIDSIMKQILAGSKFDYDFNKDAFYHQYKDAYAKQAKLASQDVMGQAAAMTGGYGNSYAASVGNQAYQAEIGKINDVIPELYQLALDRHNMNQDELYRKYQAYADDYNRQYTQHLNKLSALADARDIAWRQYGTAADEYYALQGNKNANAWNEAQWLREQKWRDEDAAIALIQNNTPVDDNDFQKAIYARTDIDGNNVFYIDGKEQTFAPGVNPYTGGTNKDIQYGAFSNGYQPDNIGGEPLTKTGRYVYVNGVKQNVWQTPDGKTWVWDGTENRYINEEDITYAD